MRLARPVVASVLLVLGLTGCATATDSVAERIADQVPVEVENRNTHDATIYAYPNAQRIRLGVVGGLETRVLHAPAPITGQLRFEIRLLAVGAFFSHTVSVAAGDTVVVTVPPDLHRRR